MNMWIQKYLECVFFLSISINFNSYIFYFRHSTLFVTKQMYDFGHKRLVACDATFVSNKYKINVNIFI